MDDKEGDCKLFHKGKWIPMPIPYFSGNSTTPSWEKEKAQEVIDKVINPRECVDLTFLKIEIASALAQARQKALEDAAKISEEMYQGEGDRIAKAIRALTNPRHE